MFRHWIPAFAGMTANGDAISEKIDISFAGMTAELQRRRIPPTFLGLKAPSLTLPWPWGMNYGFCQ